MKVIERDGIIYDVIDETDTDYCVEQSFDYACRGTRIAKTLKLWWDKRYCNVILEDCENETETN